VTDEDLLVRQAALQERARKVLAGLDLAALTADAGPLLEDGVRTLDEFSAWLASRGLSGAG
jgi:hypothetical protein